MPERKNYFNEVVGLRIYLAVWVALGHGLQLSGYLVPSNPLMKFALNGHAAVAVFMIVSGFVIANLLMVKQESYARYITRRFFRIYPAYVIGCLLGFIILNDWVAIVSNAPWAEGGAWQGYKASIIDLKREVEINFWPHVGWHVTMLHGIVPDEVINRGAMTFLPAAWSISLEWQFYLLAPLFLIALRNKWHTVALVAFTLVAFMAYRKGLLGHYDMDSSIAGNTPYFLLGIASRLFHSRLSALNVSPLMASAICIFAAVTLTFEPTPLIVWGVFLSYSLWNKHSTSTGRVFRAITTAPPVMLLGEASFSLYLLHRPIQVAAGAFFMNHMTVTQPLMLAIMVLGTVISVPLSIAMYLSVERGGIELGRRLANALPKRKPT